MTKEKKELKSQELEVERPNIKKARKREILKEIKRKKENKNLFNKK